MTTLLFLAELIGFVLVAYWAYQNDRAGANCGGEGLLKMVDPVAQQPHANKREPKWRRTVARAPGFAAPAPRVRTALKPNQPEPRWKRPLG